MKKVFFAIVAITILSASFSSLSAQKFKKIMKEKEHFAKLNLTDDQQQQFDTFHFKHQENKIEIEAKLKRNRLELKKLMVANKIDETQIMVLTSKGSDLKAKLTKSRTKMWLDIYNILKDDQKEVWIKKFRMMSMQGRRFIKNCGSNHFGSRMDNRFGNSHGNFKEF